MWQDYNLVLKYGKIYTGPKMWQDFYKEIILSSPKIRQDFNLTPCAGVSK